MLSLPPSVRIFIARGATDMRKSFDTLAALVCDVIAEDPQSGHLFVFVNRRKDRVKVLWWDRSHMMLRRHGEKHMRLSVQALSQGLDTPIYSSQFRCGSLKTMALVIPLMNLKRELPGATARR